MFKIVKKIRSDKRKNVAVATITLTVLLIAALLVSYTKISSIYAVNGVASAGRDETEGQEKEAEIKFSSAVVMSVSTGETVYDKNSERKQSLPGSGRLMNVLCAREAMHDEKEMQNKVQITADISSRGDLFTEGQNIRVKDLMYIAIISGSPEACYALAIYTSGSESAFVDVMNTKAKDLGLKNTKFVNSTDSYDPNQYSSEKDYAVLVQAAFRDNGIQKMCAGNEYVARSEGGKTINVKPPKLFKAGAGRSKKSGYKIIGGIVGSSTAANEITYMCTAIDRDMKLVIVMQTYEKNIYSNSKYLFKLGFDKVSRNTAFKRGEHVGYIMVKNGDITRVPVYTKERAFVYIPPEGSESLIEKKVVLDKGFRAPIKAGEKVGECRIYDAGELKGAVDIVTKKDVNIGWFPSYIYISNTMSVIIGLIIVIFLLIRINAARLKRKRIRRRKLERKKKIRKMAMERVKMAEDRKRRHWNY